jgi:hypothetical protein
LEKTIKDQAITIIELKTRDQIREACMVQMQEEFNARLEKLEGVVPAKLQQS